MSAATAMVSIGDEGVLNQGVSQALSEVWIDRDLGWLDFNDRVLAEALDPRNPLLERVKFLAIFTSNLDEFFMKRVAVLRAGCATPEHARTCLQQVRERLMLSLYPPSRMLSRPVGSRPGKPRDLPPQLG